MSTNDKSRLGLADKWRPSAPKSDQQPAATAILNEVLALSADLHEHLLSTVNEYYGAAPASATHVADLTARLSRTVLDWIADWPS